MMFNLRDSLIRLGSQRPKLRKHIRPILAIGMKGNLFPDLVEATRKLFDQYGYYVVKGYKGSQDTVEIFSNRGYGSDSAVVEFHAAGEGWIRVTVSEGGKVVKSWRMESDSFPRQVANRVYKEMERVF